jgi:hypothetical protein
VRGHSSCCLYACLGISSGRSIEQLQVGNVAAQNFCTFLGLEPVAIGQDVKGNVIKQCELIREILPPENEQGEVQCVHVDAAVRDPQQVTDCMAIFSTNLQYMLDLKGPLSLFFPFKREYRLVVFPTAHKPAMKCLKNFTRHYKAARAAFFEAHKQRPPVSEWKAAWCGCNVRLRHKLFPGQNFNQV